jgi:hypothetical protein
MFLFYYQGARSFSDKFQTVTDRAIGVAMSRDGIHFDKYRDNPIVTWQPNGLLEEGAAAGTSLIKRDGQILMYYGANTALNNWSVRADVRGALSADGFEFEDTGIVLEHNDSSIWGYGDELFPIAALRSADECYLYYLPNGSGMKCKLGVSWGPSSNHLIHSEPVTDPDGVPIEGWGMASQVKLAPRLHAIFISDVTRSTVEVRLLDMERPAELGPPIRSYEFENLAQGAVYHDPKSSIWYLYYRFQDGSGYGVRTARVKR